ncbi:MAG: hypothetical protein AMJ55_00350 [Gammaproteobacteria bacterium SG8_15]|nr:MAG: hypothetical protein AMJ55_00350 [Gammaproteobacteria bacterium SG8_15]
MVRRSVQLMPSWAWIIVLAALAQGVLAFSNRDVYSKSEVDYRVDSLEDKIDEVHEDIKWIMRHLGGRSGDTGSNHNTP